MSNEISSAQWCDFALVYSKLRGDELEHFIQSTSLEYDCHPETFARRLREALTWLRRFTEAGVITTETELPSLTYEEQRVALCAKILRDTSPFDQTQPRDPNDDERLVIAISDLHGTLKEELRERIAAARPHILVLTGDVLDMLAYSKFPKAFYEPPNVELQRIIALLEFFASLGIYIIIVLGNHDHRYYKYHMEKQDPFAAQDIKMHPLAIVAHSMPNVEIVCDTYDYETPTGVVYENAVLADWFTYVGDALFAHPGISRQHPCSTARAFADKFNGWSEGLIVQNTNIRRADRERPDVPKVVAIGHIHSWAIGPSDNNQTLVELGFAGDMTALNYSWAKAQTPRYGIEPGYLKMIQHRDDNGHWRTEIPTVQFLRV